jgi:hypothetical protein
MYLFIKYLLLHIHFNDKKAAKFTLGRIVTNARGNAAEEIFSRLRRNVKEAGQASNFFFPGQDEKKSLGNFFYYRRGRPPTYLWKTILISSLSPRDLLSGN